MFFSQIESLNKKKSIKTFSSEFSAAVIFSDFVSAGFFLGRKPLYDECGNTVSHRCSSQPQLEKAQRSPP